MYRPLFTSSVAAHLVIAEERRLAETTAARDGRHIAEAGIGDSAGATPFASVRKTLGAVLIHAGELLRGGPLPDGQRGHVRTTTDVLTVTSR